MFKFYNVFLGTIALTSITCDPIGCAPDINECKERLACQCDGCSCKDTWGSYECKCKGDLLYIKEHDACIGKKEYSSHTTKLLSSAKKEE